MRDYVQTRSVSDTKDMLRNARWRMLPAREFSQYAHVWAHLNRASANSPVLEPEFVQAALDHFGDGSEILALHECGDTTVAMGIFRHKNMFVWESFQPSQAPLGAWVADRGLPTADLARSLVGQLSGRTLLLGLSQLDPDSYPRPRSGRCVRTVDYIQTAYITVEGTFEEYWKKRGKNLRQNIKRQRNLLERKNIVARLEVISQPEDMAKAISDYGHMESRGWKGSAGTAVDSDNLQGTFYTKLLEALAVRGQVHVYRYSFGDQIVAMDLWISQGEGIVLLKTTYDERMSFVSPTILMRQELIRDIFDRKLFKRIEFQGRLMDWHKRWTNEVRTIYHLNVYRWEWLARFMHHSVSANARIGGSPFSRAASTGKDERL